MPTMRMLKRRANTFVSDLESRILQHIISDYIVLVGLKGQALHRAVAFLAGGGFVSFIDLHLPSLYW